MGENLVIYPLSVQLLLLNTFSYQADMNTLADHYGTRKEDNFKGHTT